MFSQITILGVFIQGILSFFSPCILPVIPLYFSYFCGNNAKYNDKGEIEYPKKEVLINTIAFVLGISATFFILGFAFTKFANILTDNKYIISLISAVLMILFAIIILFPVKNMNFLNKDIKYRPDLSKLVVNPLSAFFLGFTFSFGWTPCISPIMTSVFLLAATKENLLQALILISTYTLGFIIPFLLAAIFTRTVLSLFRKNKSVLKYTTKISAIILLILGLSTIYNLFASHKLKPSNRYSSTKVESNIQADDSNASNTDKEIEESNTSDKASNEEEQIPAPEFNLKDQHDNLHTLKDYEDKMIFLNFWATWCPPCKREMPEIQKLYDKYKDSDDVAVLTIVASDGNTDLDSEGIKKFIEENGYTFPVLMDNDISLFTTYRISSFPTTYAIDKNHNIYGYVSGALTYEMMEEIISSTLSQ